MAKYEDLRGDEYTLLAITGRAWVFGDGISQQQVLADTHRQQPPEIARAFLFAAVDSQFARQAKAGDIIVAGHGFGGGVVTADVPAALTALGIAAVVARSFAGAFCRHATDCGLPALIVEETPAIKARDILRVDVEAHIVANLSSGDRYVIRNIDDDALAVLRAGGKRGDGGPGTTR